MKTVTYSRIAARALRKHRNMAPRIIAKVEDYAANPASLTSVVTELAGRDCRRLRVGDFHVLFRETATEIIVLDIGPRGSTYDRGEPMGKPQIITSPSGDELVVLPRRDYEDLVDALTARKVEVALVAGREELLTVEETAELVAAPTRLTFWRKKRGKTQSQLAAEVGVSQNFLSDLERGKANGDVTLYGKLARCLDLSIDDLAPGGD